MFIFHHCSIALIFVVLVVLTAYTPVLFFRVGGVAGNLDDLGLWPMLTAPLLTSAPKNLDELWVELQKAFWAIDPNSLDNLCHAKTVFLLEVHKNRRGHVANPAHSGYRAMKARSIKENERPPTWTEMANWCDPKHKWIYEYCAVCREGPCVCD